MSPARKEPDASTYAGRFAIRLRQLREKAKLTPEQVAEQLGMSPNTIYSWESGRTEPKIAQFLLLSKILNLKTPKDLLPKE